MSNGWYTDDQVLVAGVAIPASQTNAPVSKEFKITAGGALNMAVAIVASAVTGTVDLKLQSSVNGQDWVDAKATTIAAPGVAYIKLLASAAADQPALPLLGKGRIVATTAGGEAITVSSIVVLQAK
jgi:hypothetical protein